MIRRIREATERGETPARIWLVQGGPRGALEASAGRQLGSRAHGTARPFRVELCFRPREATLRLLPHPPAPPHHPFLARLVLLNSLEETRETILHEIAHALCGKPGHGPEWRRIARSIGCSAERCHNANKPPPNFTGLCPTCQKEYHRYRRPHQNTRQYCRPCSRTLGPRDRSRLRWVATNK